MTQAERERLVERYMYGEMSVSEEQDFFIEVAVNDELRQTLKAYRIVETALRKDVSPQPPAARERSRTQVMAMLAATAMPAAAGSVAAAEIAAHAPAAAATASGAAGGAAATATGTFLGLGVAKLTAVVIAGSALAVGTFVVAPLVDTGDRHDSRGSGSVRTIESLPTPAELPKLPVPALVEQRSTELHATELPEASHQRAAVPAESEPRAPRTSSPARRASAAKGERSEGISVEKETNGAIPSSVESSTRSIEEVAEPTSISDSIPIRVEVELPQQ